MENYNIPEINSVEDIERVLERVPEILGKDWHARLLLSYKQLPFRKDVWNAMTNHQQEVNQLLYLEHIPGDNVLRAHTVFVWVDDPCDAFCTVVDEWFENIFPSKVDYMSDDKWEDYFYALMLLHQGPQEVREFFHSLSPCFKWMRHNHVNSTKPIERC